MTPSRPWFVLLTRITLLFLFTIVVTACPADRPPEQITQNSGPTDGEEGEMAIVGSAAPSAPEEFKVILDADEKMKVGSSHYLRVWLGDEDHLPKKMEDIVRDTTSVMAEEGSYAIVTPIAPDFEVKPDKPQRISVKKTGSSAVFTLIPRKRGKLFVTASVVIYDSEGNEDPQSTQRMTVKVSSNFWGKAEDRANEMGKAAWKPFMSFFTALVVLVLGALLFVIRKYIKKKTGYDGDGTDQFPTSKE